MKVLLTFFNSELLIIQDEYWLDNQGKSKILVKTKGKDITVKSELFISLIDENVYFGNKY